MRVFDGNGHTISHLTISGRNYLGLFGRTGSGARISNLALEAVDVNGTGDFAGGLVGGNLAGWGVPGDAISNCYSTGTVSGDRSVGSLLGIDFGSITTSYSSGMVTGTDWYVGGLVGNTLNLSPEKRIEHNCSGTAR